jgi:hypothetical protein
MTDRKFFVLYYGTDVLAMLYAPDRISAVKQMANRFGGQVGISLVEAT